MRVVNCSAEPCVILPARNSAKLPVVHFIIVDDSVLLANFRGNAMNESMMIMLSREWLLLKSLYGRLSSIEGEMLSRGELEGTGGELSSAVQSLNETATIIYDCLGVVQRKICQTECKTPIDIRIKCLVAFAEWGFDWTCCDSTDEQSEFLQRIVIDFAYITIAD